MKKIISLGVVLGATAPLFAFAQDIKGILDTLMLYLSYFVPALITVAVVYFIWGVIQFMTSADEEQKKLGRAKIINGLIGLFVIVAFWGIITVLKNSFKITNEPDQDIVPCTPGDTRAICPQG